ncbi:hypothetical protein E2P84_32235 [Burkholderia cepacia]|uniref:Uncharacterized protein n=1 Tax=Burkholderia cepacia TaxID=292 RepID=A0AAX2RRI8_BURCE|nr:hypothetical protein E2P84_32235 [Burkholderia cepacia]TES97264.1 hypothetical protein E3D36_32975 [Burkholderia cepacia]TEU33155.1 hypothetical protein E3D39_34095 [Burkholderia cepacia]TEU39898.1 hypothetical protein E3D38_35165 [Burkholderia cepacia]TEU47053.1 hypothetical protein E3D37_17135 [Burkholderia cepacia]
MFHRLHRVHSVRFRCRAVAGAGGIDAASLGFGRQTKHPARRQAPLPHVQHCAGEPRVTGILSNATAARPLPVSLRRRARIGSARIGLVLLVQAPRAS